MREAPDPEQRSKKSTSTGLQYLRIGRALCLRRENLCDLFARRRDLIRSVEHLNDIKGCGWRFAMRNVAPDFVPALDFPCRRDPCRHLACHVPRDLTCRRKSFGKVGFTSVSEGLPPRAKQRVDFPLQGRKGENKETLIEMFLLPLGRGEGGIAVAVQRELHTASHVNGEPLVRTGKTVESLPHCSLLASHWGLNGSRSNGNPTGTRIHLVGRLNGSESSINMYASLPTVRGNRKSIRPFAPMIQTLRGRRIAAFVPSGRRICMISTAGC